MKKLLEKNENYTNETFDATDELDHVFALFENIRDVGPFDHDHPLVLAAYYYHTEHEFSLDSLPSNIFDLVMNKIQSEAEECHALDAVGEYEND